MCLRMAHQAPPQLPADAGQKRKKTRLQRDFQETARWEHDEHREHDIEDFIRSELKIVNDLACLSVMPGAHKRRDNRCGVFKRALNTWVTNKGSITNTILRCLLWQGRKGGKRQRNFEALDDDFTNPSQVLNCVLLPEKHLILLGRGMPEGLHLNNIPPPVATAVPIGCAQLQHHR